MEYKYEDFDEYTLEESLEILREESEKKKLNNNDLIVDIENELKKQDESFLKCNKLIQEIVNRLNQSCNNLKCPLCEEEHVEHKQCEYKGKKLNSHYYTCEDCNFVGIEYNNAKDMFNIIRNMGIEDEIAYLCALDLPLWRVKNHYMDTLESRTNNVMCEEITIKELLDYGFNNNYLETDNYGIIELGWVNVSGEYFYEMTEKQLNVKVKGVKKEFINDYLDDEGYDIMYVKCVNSNDEILFKEN